MKYEVVIVHPPQDGLLRMTEVRWIEGPCVIEDGTQSPPRVYVRRRNGQQRDVTNLLKRLAARKGKST